MREIAPAGERSIALRAPVDLALDLAGDLVAHADDVVDLRERRGLLALALQAPAQRLDDPQVWRLQTLEPLQPVLPAVGPGAQQHAAGIEDRAAHGALQLGIGAMR